MKVIITIFTVFSIILASKAAEIDNEYLSRTIYFSDQEIDLPQEFLDELRLEIENPGTRDSGITAVVDEYADKILTNIQKQILKSGLDPVSLPNDTLNLIPTGSISLTSGWLTDTSTLSRNGDVTVSYSSSTKDMEFDIPLKFDSLLFSYNYLTKVLLLSVKGEVNGKVENLKINLKLNFNYNTYHASLEHFDIADTGKVSLKFSGNGLVDWLTNIMTSVVTTFLHPIIIDIVQSIVKGGIDSVVQAINSFIDGVLHPSTVANNLL